MKVHTIHAIYAGLFFIGICFTKTSTANPPYREPSPLSGDFIGRETTPREAAVITEIIKKQEENRRENSDRLFLYPNPITTEMEEALADRDAGPKEMELAKEIYVFHKELENSRFSKAKYDAKRVERESEEIELKIIQLRKLQATRHNRGMDCVDAVSEITVGKKGETLFKTKDSKLKMYTIPGQDSCQQQSMMPLLTASFQSGSPLCIEATEAGIVRRINLGSAKKSFTLLQDGTGESRHQNSLKATPSNPAHREEVPAVLQEEFRPTRLR